MWEISQNLGRVAGFQGIGHNRRKEQIARTTVRAQQLLSSRHAVAGV